jgi:hypothetical protein
MMFVFLLSPKKCNPKDRSDPFATIFSPIFQFPRLWRGVGVRLISASGRVTNLIGKAMLQSHRKTLVVAWVQPVNCPLLTVNFFTAYPSLGTSSVTL